MDERRANGTLEATVGQRSDGIRLRLKLARVSFGAGNLVVDAAQALE